MTQQGPAGSYPKAQKSDSRNQIGDHGGSKLTTAPEPGEEAAKVAARAKEGRAPTKGTPASAEL